MIYYTPSYCKKGLTGMSFLGNKNGPRESEILNKLGPDYFGCSAEALEEDISHHSLAESRGEVVPVHVDEKGRPYLKFSSHKLGETQNFILEDNGYFLEGEIATFTDEEAEHWNKRLDTETDMD